MELVSFGLREREKEGEKEMIKERRKTARADAERNVREGAREGWRGKGQRWRGRAGERKRQHSMR